MWRLQITNQRHRNRTLSIPRIEELFSELQKGERFSNRDLSQVYMQLTLDPESQKLCNISTHRRLFSYKHLPYGVNSGPSIFQQKIDPVWCILLDDILISATERFCSETRKI